jgi:hypothetical protein
MRSSWASWMSAGLRAPAAFALLAAISFASPSKAEITIQDRRSDVPLVLNKPDDYILKNVRVAGVLDHAALTLSGPIRSIRIENSKFGEVRAATDQKAAAMEAVSASVGQFTVTDSAFYDAENQLVSLRNGSFGTVTFTHCTFKTSDAFLKAVYAANPWRTTPPVTEFYNIDRLELLDNEFSNTTIVIHPSVKTVVLRGSLTNVQVESPQTRIVLLNPTMPAGPTSNPVYACGGIPKR